MNHTGEIVDADRAFQLEGMMFGFDTPQVWGSVSGIVSRMIALPLAIGCRDWTLSDDQRSDALILAA